MTATFCPRCGAQRVGDLRFCAQCGYDLAGVPQSAVSAPSPASTTSAAGTPVGPTAPAAARDGNSLILIVAGVLVIVGSFLPWISAHSGFGTISRSGIEGGGDGLFTLIAGVGIAAIGASRFFGFAEPSGAVRFFPPLIAGLIVIGLAVIDGIQLGERARSVASEFVIADIGEGLYVVGLGGVLSVLGALTGRPPKAAALVAGWWRVEESEFPGIVAGLPVHLMFESGGLAVRQRTGEPPILTLSRRDPTLVMRAVDNLEVLVTIQGGPTMILSRSTDAMSTSDLVRNWATAKGR